jgi:long-chain acyl-CoA synthetase
MSEEWEPIFDYENVSSFVNPNRPWLKLWSEGIPKSIKFKPICVHDYIRNIAEKYPNNVAIEYLPNDKKFTYREIFWYADKISNALFESLRVKKGDSVAVMTGNAPEFIFSIFGITQCGASVCPINPLLKASDVVHIIREAGNINTIFVHKANYRTVKKASKEVKIENIIILQSEEGKDDAITFEEFIEDAIPKPPKVDIDPMNDLAALLFTGGTTGLPKGVMLTHYNLVADALASQNMEKVLMDERIGKGVAVQVIPICHSFGFEVVIISLAAAALMLLPASFNPEILLELIEKYKIELVTLVPVMYQMLVNHPDFRERDLSSITSAISGSAGLPPEVAYKWEKGTNGIKVGQGFGLTETSPVTHMQPRWLPEIKPESIGIPLIDTDAIIVNPETLKELEIGEVGELLIKGPQVMKGYWKRPKATKEVLIEGDWLRTGDLARMDEDGYFYIEGRAKDIIKYKGYKVMPKEVEEKLVEHPAILEAGVVGVPDPNIGETIKAFVVIKEEYKEKVNERDIIEWAKQNLAGYKYPRQVEFLPILPRTFVGKIFRRKLREIERK